MGDFFMHQAFHDLFIYQLHDIYSAEIQVIEALPNIIAVASNKELREALENHLAETNNHKNQLDEVFNILKESSSGQICEGMKGILQEFQQILNRKDAFAIKDAALIGAIQKCEHYLMACYGILRTYANHLEYEEVKKILQKSLDEEGKSNKKLTNIAEGSFFWSGINSKAMKE